MFNCDLEVFLLLRSRDLQVSDICTSCGDSYYYWLELITIIRTQSLLELSDCSHLKQLNPLWVAPVNHGCSDYLSLTTARLKKTKIRLSGSFLNCPISLVSDCVKSGGWFWSKSETMTSSGSFYRISRPINMLNYNPKLKHHKTQQNLFVCKAILTRSTSVPGPHKDTQTVYDGGVRGGSPSSLGVAVSSLGSRLSFRLTVLSEGGGVDSE